MSDVISLLSSLLSELSPEQRSALAELVRPAPEPIAIVGVGCRFPGASSPEAFWELIDRGGDAISEVPSDRWDASAFYDPDTDAPGRTDTRWGGFLDRVDLFDPGFFDISPREATRMDPQQRLLLEVAWEALEAACVTPRIAGSPTGVFVGIHSHSSDYSALQLAETTRIDGYVSTGTAHSLMANRLSYALDLRGPSLSVDTACSSSLVAVHLACQSVRSGESDLALACGVNLLLTPETTISLSKLRMMAPDGRCKAFDARANGFVRGEGCGVVVLERLSDAQRHGDPVLALIRGTAVNQDGRTSGITAPSGVSQQDVLRRALRDAGIAPAEVSYIEAHGTGTALGDPIEVEALIEVLSEGRPEGRPCFLGAVKTNIGHLEGAAGIAGLIKAALCLRHARLSPVVHFQSLNPHISLDGMPLVIPTRSQPWRAEGERIAGVSSFGFGGTNAHAVLAEAPLQAGVRATPAGADRVALLPVSARSAGALRRMAESYERLLAGEASATGSLQDISYTAGTRRTHHIHRLAVVGRSRDELSARLRAFLDQDGRPGVRWGKARAAAPGVVLVFSGQGAQWAGMARGLSEQEPVFRAAIEQCDAVLRPLTGGSIIDELASDTPASRLARTDVAQPVLFALQVALAALWRSWGIVPEAVLGHSVGEVAAAHVAGVLDLKDAAKVVFHRSRLMQRTAGRGRMLAAALTRSEALPLVEAAGGRLSIAAINAPRAVVLSGDPALVQEAAAALQRQNVLCRALDVDYAFHSDQMQPLRAELVQSLRDLAPRPAALHMESTVTGRRVDGRELDAEHWARNLCEPVLFGPALAALPRDHDRVYVELGPHPVLGQAIADVEAELGGEPAVLPSLRRGQEGRAVLLESLGALYTLGCPVAWTALHTSARRCVSLPSYAWDRARYWVDARPVEARPAVQSAAPWRRWLHRVDWEVQPLEAGSAAARVGVWLIFADAGGVGEELAQTLRSRGHRCALVSAGEVLSCAGEGRWTVDPARREDFTVLLRDAVPAATPEAPLGIAYLWALDAPVAEDASPDALARVHALVCGGVLHLLQAIPEAWPRSACRVHLVTRGAQAVRAQGERIAVVQAPLWGLGRVIALEREQLWGGLVDLDPDDAAPGRSLAHELLSPGDEDQVARRGEARYVARLVPFAPPEDATSPAPALDPGASYLITGGLGALGLQVARWMVERGARSLVLTARRGLPERGTGEVRDASDAERAIQALRALGAEVRVAAADAGDPARMEALLNELRASPRPLRGVVHAAGVGAPCLLAQLGVEGLREAAHPKVAGAWALHQLTRDMNLDFFVLFSSISAAWGARGLGHYAAANHFMDALAAHRRALGLPALSVAWGPWAGGGMAMSLNGAALADVGLAALQPSHALSALGHLLGAGTAHAAVVSIDWEVHRAVYEARRTRPLFARLGGEAHRAVEPPADHGALLRRLQAAPPIERLPLLMEQVQREVALTLGFDVSHPIDLQQGFFQMGMDSLMAVRLRDRLQTRLGCVLPSTITFERPTIEALAGHLAWDVLGLEPPARRPRSGVADEHHSAIADVERLSDGQVDALIQDELARLLG